ncbi:uncharacterized protein FMAN_06812 [Fusarium mangiferae]|uniref:RRM domain-containing protein n=1 Tax=Fusarium mangiferae TaxID=192010 RepID=A0A1L7UL00_FUSMA|nr:uncharacterized protein FMAN_06812 [Fusarium mangiferae]CVL08755.1 uncharacterized protein FMAN_06812 [Fusarium mangiferae]
MFQFWEKFCNIRYLIGSLNFNTGAWGYFNNLLQYLGLYQWPSKAAGQIDTYPSPDSNVIDGAKLHVDNISWDTTEDTLLQVFSEYGDVTDTVVMRDTETGHSRHFGFVTFSTYEEACDARQGLHNEEVDGRRLRVREAPKRRQEGQESDKYKMA